MPRPPEIPGKPATNQIKVLVNDQMLAFIDQMRGPKSRPAYIRDTIRAAATKERP